ncbi:MAG: YccF domain-containing protein [Clostridia bacterium]|nr:YccF domain-containing protein [Clostridia bacterium]
MTQIKASTKQNVAWILLIGIWGAILSSLLGIVSCLTIVGIPAGIKHFKFIKYLFTKENIALAYRPNTRRKLLGLYWYAFGGVGAKLFYFLIAYLFSISGVGIPLAVRFERISSYLSCPFAVLVVENGQYTEGRNTLYDYNLLQRRIYKSPTIAIFDERRGKLVTVRRYLKGFENEVFSSKRSCQIVFFLFAALILFGVAMVIGTGIGAVAGVFLMAVGLIGCYITSTIQTKQLLRIYDTYMKKLFDLYDENDPYDQTPVIIPLYYVFDKLAKDREERKRLKNQRNIM